MSVKYLIRNDTFVSAMKKQRCNNDLLLKIAKRIKQLREDKNISQEMFYYDTEIHIARIETAKTNITVGTLQDICNYFSISLAEFFSKID